MRGAIAAGHPADRRGRRRCARGGRQRGRRVRRRRVRVLGGREPADRARAAAGSCSSTARATARRGCSTSSSPCRGSAVRPQGRRDGGDRQSTSTARPPQVFRIGAASCAVPGRRRGPRGGAPLVRVAAVGAARRAGGRARARRRRADARSRLPARDPRPDPPPHGRGAARLRAQAERLGAGDRLVLADLGDTLERIGRQGARGALRAASSAARSSRTCGETGGGDHGRRPRAPTGSSGAGRCASAFRGHEVLSNPPPSSGGVLIAYGLALLDRLGQASRPAAPTAIAQLAEVMREQDARPRAAASSRELYRGGLARELLANANVARARRVARRGRRAEPVVRHDAHLGRRRAPATPPRCRRRPARARA